jgi:peptidoglycan hydrolase-like protein with peptidoglycan-binding domain
MVQLKALMLKAQQQGVTLPPSAAPIVNAAPVSAPAAVTSGSASVPPSGSYGKNLASGSSNSDVTALQRFLAAQGPSIYPEGAVSGYYGSLTQKAVGRFQEKYGIAKPGEAGYGTVGPKTRAKLNELTGR